jgi:outer membrane receptor for ferrienterochelin and colicin
MTYVNVSKASSQGIELGLDWGATEHLGFSLNYTGQHTEDEDTGKNLDYMPENKINTTIRFQRNVRTWRLALSLDEMFVGERIYRDRVSNRYFELDSYWRTDAAFRASRKNGWIEIKVQNLMNEDYEETGGDLAPARMIIARAGLMF